MENRRIGPEGAFVRDLKSWQQRVASLETKPAGRVVTRESFEYTDPATGVKTIIGQLPDGSSGLGEWIGDTEPPAKPSTPIASAYLGVLSVYWDGEGFLGEPNPPDYDRTDVEMASSIDGPWFKVGELRGEGSVQVTDQAYGEARYFRFLSYDKPGNVSQVSDIASATATAIVDEQSISDEISRIDQNLADANADITTISNDLAPLPGRISQVETDLEPLPGKLNQLETDLAPLPGRITQVETDLAPVPGQIIQLQDDVAPLPQMIDEAASSVITDARLVEGSLTKWPFQSQTIPSGAFAPGAVNGNDIANFSLAVTKLQSNRHQLY